MNKPNKLTWFMISKFRRAGGVVSDENALLFVSFLFIDSLFFRLEIFEEQPDIENVFVPVGGGGLIAGIAAYLKQVNPDIKVSGFTPFFYYVSFFLSFGPYLPTASDSLQGSSEGPEWFTVLLLLPTMATTTAAAVMVVVAAAMTTTT